MKKYLSIVILLMGFSLSGLAQKTGIKTKNPQGALHVDAKKNNAASGVPTAAEADDDFIVDANGNVGVGILAPSTKLHLITKGTAAIPIAGIRIEDGTQGSNYVLLSDANGNAKWVNHPVMRPNVMGVVASGPVTEVLSSGTAGYRYSGFSITLTEGDWIVSAGLTFTDIGATISGDLGFWQTAHLSSSSSMLQQVGFSHLGVAGNATCYGAPMIKNGSRGTFLIGFVTGSSVINVPEGATTTIYLLIKDQTTGYYKYRSDYLENFFYAFPIVK